MLGLLVCCATGWSAGPVAGQELGEDFFERQVRPLLLAKCVACHGPEVQEAGVRLDTREFLVEGADAGPVVDLENHAQSRLLQVVAYADDDVQMPPDGSLSQAQIDTLRHWIENGLPWPDTAVMGDPLEARLYDHQQEHWAYQPIVNPVTSIPGLKDLRHPIDRLLQDKLQEVDLSCSPPADDRTRVRRLYFTLLGLPPTEAELTRFSQDPRPDRWEQLINELLARPQFGERWARHWLDVARYADTQGYAFANDRRYPHAYTYRDYVVQAFNDDLPYDQFILQQLAADQLDLGDDLTPLAAMGLITVGRRFIDNHDTLDDRIDVVTRGLLGLTVSCARCHDHKYDAISIADYYSLYGVFASSVDPEIKPPIGPRDQVEARQAFEQQQRELQGQLDSFRNQQIAQQKEQTIQRLADYILAVYQPPADLDWEKTDQRVSLGSQDLRPRMIQKWKERLEGFGRSRGNEGQWFRPLQPLMSLPDEDFPRAVEQQLAQWEALLNPAGQPADPAALGRQATEAQGEGSGDENQDAAAQSDAQADAQQADPNPERRAGENRRSRPRFNRRAVSPEVLELLKQADLQSKQDVAAFFARLMTDVWDTFQEHGANDRAVLKVEASRRFLIELFRGDSPLNIPAGEIGLHLDDEDFQQLQQRQTALDQHNATAPPPLPRAMALVDRDQMVQPYVFQRGNPGSRGPEVPRQFLTLLSLEPSGPYPENASGRLQMAQQIIAPDNPLTARVIVNRVWMHHFGTPLVDTPSDFGVRSNQPLQQELLDHLASYLQSQGWSLKALHRYILTSQAFQQASDDRPEARAVDPENRRYWRMNRRRMEWEALRDSLLAATDQLDLTVGGPAIDLFRSQASNRRSLYGTIDRQDLPNLLRSFDFASPDASAAQRPQTTVPQQNLYLMNGPLVHDLAGRLLESSEWQTLPDQDARIQWLFGKLLLRSPTEEEAAQCRQFMDDAQVPTATEDPEAPIAEDAASPQVDDPQQRRWQILVQALLMSNEFCFVD